MEKEVDTSIKMEKAEKISGGKEEETLKKRSGGF